MAVKNRRASVLARLKNLANMEFDKNNFLLTQWSHFSPAAEANLIFSDALHRLVIFLSPIVEAVFAQETYAGHWDSRTAKWQD